jgi:hypothetical protein
MHKRLFWLALLVSLAVRTFLASRVPIIGDEAYYLMWGKYPSLGYYDHPPMIGWISTLILPLAHALGNSWVIFRLPSLLLSVAMAPFLLGLLRRRIGEERAYLATSVFLLAPIHALNFFYAIEVPLVFFCFVSVYFYDRALHEKKLSWAMAAGVALGLAFLSKYFAVLVGFAFAAHTLLWVRSRLAWKTLIVTTLCSLPFVALHLYWSATHCWACVAFNLSGRNVLQFHHIEYTEQFLEYQLYLLGPALLYAIARRFKAFGSELGRIDGSIFLLGYLVPMAMFLYSSFQASQGFHWTLAFYPLLYVAAAFALESVKELKTTLAIQTVFTGLQAAVLVVVAVVPVDHWKDRGFYGGLMLSFHAPAIARALNETTPPDTILATDGYTESSLMEIYSPRHVAVIGEGVLFGREDDFLTDFRQWDGKDVVIFTRHARDVSEYARYFESISRDDWNWQGSPYYLYRGHAFKYAVYRDGMLAGIRAENYKTPSWLPAPRCELWERYFPLQPIGPK